MAQNLVSVDGKYYNIRIPRKGIERNFEILDGESAKRLLSGRMDRDIIGTYYNYTIRFDFLGEDPTEYDELWETLSAPVDYHTIIVPYAQSTLVFEAYVSKGRDVLDLQDDETNRWSDLSINFIAMEPKRYPV